MASQTVEPCFEYAKNPYNMRRWKNIRKRKLYTKKAQNVTRSWETFIIPWELDCPKICSNLQIRWSTKYDTTWVWNIKNCINTLYSWTGFLSRVTKIDFFKTFYTQRPYMLKVWKKYFCSLRGAPFWENLLQSWKNGTCCHFDPPPKKFSAGECRMQGNVGMAGRGGVFQISILLQNA